MPFQAAWRDYQPSDLLYGLRDNRQELAGQFGITDGQTYTIDQYDTFSAPTNARNLRYDPGFIDALLDHPRFRSTVNYDLDKDDNWRYNPVLSLAQARRKCKGGLRWITQFTNRHIHFLLDGIDLEAAANKSLANYDGGEGHTREFPIGKAPADIRWHEKVRSVTGEELRWIYRFRNNATVQARIQFWKRKSSWTRVAHGQYTSAYEFIPCPPPWSDRQMNAAVRAAWAAYIPTPGAI